MRACVCVCVCVCSLYLVLCNFVNLSSSKVLPAIVEKCVELLHEHLAPLAKTGNKGGKTLSPDAWSQVDLKFLTWLLMFISHFLDLLQEDLNTSSDPTRFSWDFVAPSGRPAAGSQSQPHGGGDSRQRMKDSFKELRRRFKAKLVGACVCHYVSSYVGFGIVVLKPAPYKLSSAHSHC